ncbi:MAG: DNA alkylation repair protein [Lentimicrobium sp.]
MTPTDYSEAMQAFFAPYENSCNAGRMSKYMLNKFDFFGIQSPLRKQLTGQFILLNGIPDPGQLDETVKLIWQMPQRELHYAIMEIASRKVYLADEAKIQLFEWMVINQSWWDTVDYIASNLVGTWLFKYRYLTGEVTERFMLSGNLWLQRTVLLFQLKYKVNTDLDLLFRNIRALNGSKEFFIRKAIGWALREYSKTNPQAVLDFTANTELSPLSRREALKVILKKQNNE